MGKFVIKPFVIFLASLITAVLVYLNISMVIGQASGMFNTPGNLFWKILIILAGLGYLALLVIAIVYPLLKNKKIPGIIPVHPKAASLQSIETPVYNKIAIALDFSKNDLRIINHAIGQGNADTTYVLIHVVESAATRLMEKETHDMEAIKDKEQLDDYVEQLKLKGIKAESYLGFNERVKEIVRIVKKTNSEMLVIGAHGHSGIRDWLYGETVGAVRHELKIPVLVVNL
jgi:manganese transport protein